MPVARVQRVSPAVGRAGRTYRLVFDPLGTDDPGPFLQCHDATPAAIRHRLETYHVATEPLKRYYEARSPLLSVDAGGPIAARLGLCVPSAA